MTRKTKIRAVLTGRLFLGRPFLLTVVVVGAVAWGLFSGGDSSRPRTVVIITVDTLRADPGKTDMPALFALARSGVHCERARTVAPLTLPAHASLLSGRSPAIHGVRDNTAAPLSNDRGFPMLAEQFRDAGFRTAAFVASGVLDARFGLDAGFDHYESPPTPKPGEPQFRTARAEDQVAALKAWLKDNPGDSPRFIWIHLWDPHDPYLPYEGDSIRPEQTTLSDAAKARYWGEVRRADRAIGEIVGLFDRDTTCFVVTADHGEGLGEHGESTHGFLPYGATMDIPLVLAGGGLAKGVVYNQPASILDVAPTLRQMCGLAPQAGEGLSLLVPPRADVPVRRTLVGESLYGNRVHGWAQVSVATDGRFSLVDAGPRLELFDRERDPREERPIENPERHPAYARLDRALLDYQRQQPAAKGVGGEQAIAGTPYGTQRRAVGQFLPRAKNAQLSDPVTSLPNHALVNRMNAAIARAAADPAEAAVVEYLLGLIESLERRDPRDPSASLARGRALLFVLGRPEEAVGALDEAQRRGYRSPELERMVVIARVESALKQRDVAAAVKILESAIARGLGNEALKRRLRELQDARNAQGKKRER